MDLVNFLRKMEWHPEKINNTYTYSWDLFVAFLTLSLVFLAIRPDLDTLMWVLLWLIFLSVFATLVLFSAILLKRWTYEQTKIYLYSKLESLQFLRVKSGSHPAPPPSNSSLTRKELNKLYSSKEFERYTQLKKKHGDNFIMCSIHTAQNIAGDMKELRSKFNQIYLPYKEQEETAKDRPDGKRLPPRTEQQPALEPWEGNGFKAIDQKPKYQEHTSKEEERAQKPRGNVDLVNFQTNWMQRSDLRKTHYSRYQ